MERLPYIDEHVTTVAADSAATWAALVRMWCRDPDDPSTVRSPFFRLDEAEPLVRLALNGEHPFAVYRLVFELSNQGPHRTELAARTWADFPGLHGKVYRALVISTGGHRIAVRRMLRRIAGEAIRAQSGGMRC
jgi:hypothetical protein